MKKFYLGCLVSLCAINAAATDYYLIGGFNGWKLADASAKFAPTELSGVYSLKVTDLTSGFKINDGTWNNNVNYGSNGTVLTPGTPYKYAQTQNREAEIKMDVTVADATVYLDINDGIVYVSGAASSKVIGWDVFGDFTGTGAWTGIELRNTSGPEWKSDPVVLKGKGGFGVRQLADGNQDVWYASSTAGVVLSEANPSVIISTGAVRDFTYDLDGTYIFTLDTSTNELSIEKYTVDYPATIYLVGNKSGAEWSAIKGKQLVDEGNGIFTLTDVQLGDETHGYLFAFVGQLATRAYSYDGISDFYFPPSQDNVKVNLKAGDSTEEPVKRFDSSPSGSWGVNGGIYDLKLDFLNNTLTISCKNIIQTNIYDDDVPAELYVLGSLENQSWSPSQGIKMAYIGNGIFKLYAYNVHTFSLSTALLPEGDNDWGKLNSMNVRYGIEGSVDKVLRSDQSAPFVQAISPMAVKAEPAGDYTIEVNWPNKTITIYNRVITGVEPAITENVDVAPVYYDMLGVRVENPRQGIYIVKRGDSVTKELIR